MNLFVFASQNGRNIEIGYQERCWATSMIGSSPHSRARWSKAEKNMALHSRGLIYCTSSQDFMMPFVVTGLPEDKVVDDVWPDENWEFPFKIHPLGSPWKRVHKDVAKREWPMLSTRPDWQNAIMGIHGVTAFDPNEIELSQWQQILRDLAEEPDQFPPESESRNKWLLDLL